MKKKILYIIFLFVFLIFFTSFSKVYAENNDLSFKLIEVVDGGEWKNVKIEVTNSSSTIYAYGFCSSTSVTFYNNYNDKQSTSISSSEKIYTGKSYIVLNINLKGLIKKITIDGPIKLNSSGLPMNNNIGYKYECLGIEDYKITDSSLETNLSMKLERLEDDGITKHAYITIINNSDYGYRVGFMDKRATFVNSLGKKVTVDISSHQNVVFNPHTQEKLDLYVELEDRITAIYFNNVGKLKKSSELVENGSEFDCYVSLIYAKVLNTVDLFKISAVQKDVNNGIINNIKLVFTNNTDNGYAISGWNNKSTVYFLLKNGSTKTYTINENIGINVLSGKVVTYNLKVDLDSEIDSIAIDNILQLKDNNLPIDVGGKGFRKNIELKFDEGYNYEQNGLSFKLNKVKKTDNIMTKLYMTPNIKSSKDFRYGTSRTRCLLIVTNNFGEKYQCNLDLFQKIQSGVECGFDVYISGSISSIEIRNLFILDNRGLPVNDSNFDLNVDISSYTFEKDDNNAIIPDDSKNSGNESNNSKDFTNSISNIFTNFKSVIPFIILLFIIVIVIFIARRRKK